MIMLIQTHFFVFDMTELKQLNLRCCSRITDRTLTRGIKFLRLQFLDLSGIRNVSSLVAVHSFVLYKFRRNFYVLF